MVKMLSLTSKASKPTAPKAPKASKAAPSPPTPIGAGLGLLDDNATATADPVVQATDLVFIA